MNLNFIFILFASFFCAYGIFAMQNDVKRLNLSYEDQVFVLKKIFSNSRSIKNSLDLWNSRYARRQKARDDKYIFDIRFDEMPEQCQADRIPRNCFEATTCTRRSGIYKIIIEKFSHVPFFVECDIKTEGGDWILIQRRQDGSVDFYRDWVEYQKGFGRIDGEFFIGLDKLHALTNYNGAQELLVILKEGNEVRKAKYNNFVIGNEQQNYVLQHLGDYSGDAGDSLLYHLGMNFTTRDKDSDLNKDGNCAKMYLGAWWYNNCHYSNLNGKYDDTTIGRGINWKTFRQYNVSMKHVTMMIRRRRVKNRKVLTI